MTEGNTYSIPSELYWVTCPKSQSWPEGSRDQNVLGEAADSFPHGVSLAPVILSRSRFNLYNKCFGFGTQALEPWPAAERPKFISVDTTTAPWYICFAPSYFFSAHFSWKALSCEAWHTLLMSSLMWLPATFPMQLYKYHPAQVYFPSQWVLAMVVSQHTGRSNGCQQ